MLDEIDIDDRIKEIIKEKGISHLYPPQAEALPPVLAARNIVVAAPTASGKSLVAYISCVQMALRGYKCMYVVPLKALAKEKYEDLLPFEKLGIKVGISTGDLQSRGNYLGKYDIIVCTSEKADSLLRHLPDWLMDVGLLVVDEIHLLNDVSRGPTLEIIMTKFRTMLPNVQFIAMSATIKNAHEIAKWLNAELVESEWRPVPLKEGILSGRKVYFSDGSILEIQNPRIEGLIEDTVEGGGQVLIFVNTRKSAESNARKLRKIMAKFLKEEEKKELEKISERLKGEEGNILLTKLAECIGDGVAFHHAGLDYKEREVVEKEFKKGLIKCIVATPTLAAGVNIPARRVIIKNLWRYSDMHAGMRPLPVMEVKQMMGRAGRPGYDEYGEAILIARNKMEKERLWNEYIMADVEPVYSKLANEVALRMHLLAIISTDFATTWDEIIHFMKKTFYVHQLGMIPEDKIWDIIDFLEVNEFIESIGERWQATRFGKLTTQLYLDPLSALIMKRALLAGEGNIFAYLHAISSTPDMKCLYASYKDEWLEDKILQEKFLLPVPSPFEPEYENFLSEVKTACLLEDWINERKMDEMILKYNVGPGDIHSKVETAQWLLHGMEALARLFNFDEVPVISKLRLRIKYGCREELLSLTQLNGIGRVRARQLYKHGFKSISMLRKASIETLAGIPGIGRKIAENIKRQVGYG